MSDQVSIVVHRRLPDGTWPPGEEPPEYRTIFATTALSRWTDYGFIDGTRFQRSYCGGAFPAQKVIAWADVSDVFAGGRESHG